MSYQPFQIAKMKIKSVLFLPQTIANIQGTQKRLEFMIPYAL